MLDTRTRTNTMALSPNTIATNMNWQNNSKEEKAVQLQYTMYQTWVCGDCDCDCEYLCTSLRANAHKCLLKAIWYLLRTTAWIICARNAHAIMKNMAKEQQKK